MKFLDWIENVDQIEDSYQEEWEDNEGDIRNHDEDESELLDSVKQKLQTEEPSKEIIKGIETIAKRHIDRIVEAVEERHFHRMLLGSIPSDMEYELERPEDCAVYKHKFFIKVLCKMLYHEKWSCFVYGLQRDINECVNNILLHCLHMYEEHVDPILTAHEQCERHLAIAFKQKTTITKVVMNTWSMMIEDYDANEPARTLQTKVSLDLYLPTMRRLGMLDILDRHWMYMGLWYEIISEMEDACGGHVKKILADRILQEKSKTLRAAYDSLSRRKARTDPMRKHLYKDREPWPQCFTYQPKCSAHECTNIETAKSPHRIRCKKCWYFHCCSPACEKYANLFDMHHCDFTPKDKALGMKMQTEKYLALTPSKKQEKCCNFCLTKEDNLPSKKLLKCSGCKSSESGPVFYCSTQCQKSDWHFGTHKADCKNR